MKNGKVKRIDFGYKKYGKMADKFYNDGDYISALRFAYKQFYEHGGDADVYARLADIYENMGLNASAVNWLFRYLDQCEEDELPDIYESLAVNFLNMGNERQAAYYYNRLIDVDDTLPDDVKMDIANTFAKNKKDNFRFIYPPQIADYTDELEAGAKALKAGNCELAIAALSKVEKGSKVYAQAKELEAVALLLSERADEAERICLDVLKDEPDNVQISATLAAAFLEQGKFEESRALALNLAARKQNTPEETYKVATVCCENDLHEEAYKKFELLEKDMPYDGRMLYFKGVAAYKSGRLNESIATFERLTGIYPDAEVAVYYLKRLREHRDGENAPSLTYYYRLPKEEYECRKSMLLHIEKSAREEAELLGLLARREGYFQWAFDESDGADHELQYHAVAAAVKAEEDEFIEGILLDPEVADVLKLEILYMLLNRNRNEKFGLVLCNIYRKIPLLRIQIGRVRYKRFVDGYAKIASKFAPASDGHARRLKTAAERLYRALEKDGRLELIENSDDVACAIYFASGLKDIGSDVDTLAGAMGASAANVYALLASLPTERTEKRGVATARNQSGEKKE